jgi:hypothetical protein
MLRKPHGGLSVPVVIDPVTVLAVLNAVRLKKGTRLDNPAIPAVVHLTHVLKLIWLKVHGVIEARTSENWVQSGFPAVRQARNPMLDAMDAQESQDRLDKLRKDKRRADAGLRLEDEETARELGGKIKPLEEKVARLGSTMPEFYERHVAERDARKRALESAQPIVDKPVVTEWKHFAVELDLIFDAALPHRSVDAADRFIAAVVSAITGETPSPNAVVQFFKYRRVKRREQVSKVNRQPV